MALFRVTRGQVVHGAEGKPHRTYKAGEELELTEEEAKHLGGAVERVELGAWAKKSVQKKEARE